MLNLEVNSTQPNMDPKAHSTPIVHFAAKFCNELDKSRNVVSSPLSAEFVLGLLTLGTTELAHSELLTSLGIADDDAIRSTFSAISSKVTGIKGVTLNVANKVYIKDGPYELQPKFEEDAVKIFNTPLEKVDFANTATVKAINEWVESKTNDKIKDLISKDSVDNSTRLLLINALYFKGAWKDKFDRSNTLVKTFHVSANSTVEVPMMTRTDKYFFGHSEGLQARLLKLPYEGDEANMLIVLPKAIEGLTDVMTKLADGYDLMSDVNDMFNIKVRVAMPKFKIETTIDLKELLPKLGINAIFNTHNSGLTKLLNGNNELSVSSAVQKAFIEVNEEGAEAAAATGLHIVLKSAPMPFFADRPFLYLLLGGDQIPLFIGIYRGIA